MKYPVGHLLSLFFSNIRLQSWERLAEDSRSWGNPSASMLASILQVSFPRCCYHFGVFGREKFLILSKKEKFSFSRKVLFFFSTSNVLKIDAFILLLLPPFHVQLTDSIHLSCAIHENKIRNFFRAIKVILYNNC